MLIVGHLGLDHSFRLCLFLISVLYMRLAGCGGLWASYKATKSNSEVNMQYCFRFYMIFGPMRQ